MAVKKSGKKTSKRTASSGANRRSTGADQQKSSSAKYVLTIMVLAAAILFIMSKQNKSDKNVIEKKNTVKNEKQNENKTSNRDVIKKTDDNLKKQDTKTDSGSNDSQKVSTKVYFIHITDSGAIKYVPVTISASDKDKYLTAARSAVSVKASQNNKMESAFPAGVKVYGVDVKNRTAVINISSEINNNAVGDILTARLNQLLLTMKSFDDVDGIEIMIEGKRINTFGGDGRVLNWPLREKL